MVVNSIFDFFWGIVFSFSNVILKNYLCCLLHKRWCLEFDLYQIYISIVWTGPLMPSEIFFVAWEFLPVSRLLFDFIKITKVWLISSSIRTWLAYFFPFQSFSAIQNEPCWGCSLIELQKAPFPKIFHTYRTIMKLLTVVPYLKKIQNYMDGVTYSMNSAEISIFEPKKTNFFYMKILIQMYIAL